MLRTESNRGLDQSQGAPGDQDGSASPAPEHEDIACRAYEVYLESGGRQGRCRENWERAERELRQLADARHTLDFEDATAPQDDTDREPVVRTFPDAIRSMQRDNATHGVSPQGPRGNFDAIT